MSAQLRGLATEPRAKASIETHFGHRVRELKKHDTLFSAGDRAANYYEVLNGSLLAYRMLDDGRRQGVEWVREGDICGFATGPEHDSSCEALETTRVRVFEKSGVSGNDDFRDRLLSQYDRQVGALYEHLLGLGRKSAAERVATLLIRQIAAPGGGACPIPPERRGGAVVQMPMSRAEMADYLGLTIETVCRTLADMKRHKLIDIGEKRGEIEIVSVCGLCHAAKTDVCMQSA